MDCQEADYWKVLIQARGGCETTYFPALIFDRLEIFTLAHLGILPQRNLRLAHGLKKSQFTTGLNCLFKPG